MKINITGRHIEVTPALRDYIKKKIEKVKYYFEHVIDAHVILKVMKIEHIAETTIHSEGKTFFCEAHSEDMYSSVDALFDKLERQVRKYKEKIMNHKAVTKTALNFLKRRQSDKDSVMITKVKEVQTRPMTGHEAILQLALNSHNFEIFHEDKAKDRDAIAIKTENNTYCIIEKNDSAWEQKEYELKGDDLILLKEGHIEIEELGEEQAINQLLDNELEYLIFYDNEVNNLNILYVRRDHTLGLITSG